MKTFLGKVIYTKENYEHGFIILAKDIYKAKEKFNITISGMVLDKDHTEEVVEVYSDIVQIKGIFI